MVIKVVQAFPLLPPDFNHIRKSGIGQQGGFGPLFFKHGICSHSGAVHNPDIGFFSDMR